MTTETIEAEVTETIEVKDEKTIRLEKAGQMIASASRWSVGASLIPLPYVDLAALASVQANLIVDISKLYGEKPSKEAVKGVITVLLATLVPAGATHVAAGALAKFIPVVGSVAGAITLAAFGSAATYAVGKVFVRHFEQGGTLDNFSTEAVQADLKKEFASASA